MTAWLARSVVAFVVVVVVVAWASCVSVALGAVGIPRAASNRLAAPVASRALAAPPLVIRDVVSVRVARALSDLSELWNGGPVVTPGGETLRILASSSYVDSPSARQSWAAFFGWLPHGAELSRLTVYMAPLWEVQQICGAGALGCYGPSIQSMVVPGDRRQVNMDQVMAHEYGHHIASNRRNDPWNPNQWGAKRWATYANVCQRVQSGSAAPGDEGANYQINPGEAFADTYRFMVGTRATGSTSWNTPPAGGFLTPSFPNDAGAYAAVFADATTPWTGAAHSEWQGQLKRPLVHVRVKKTIHTKNGSRRVWRIVTRPKTSGPPVPSTYSIPLPYDGIVTATINSAPPGAGITVLDASGTSTIGPVGVAAASFTVCGQRGATVRLTAAAPGAFDIALETP